MSGFTTEKSKKMNTPTQNATEIMNLITKLENDRKNLHNEIIVDIFSNYTREEYKKLTGEDLDRIFEDRGGDDLEPILRILKRKLGKYIDRYIEIEYIFKKYGFGYNYNYSY